MKVVQLKGGTDYRVYQVHNDDESHLTQVRVWNEGPETFVSTTIGDPSKITSGTYRSDDDAIIAHFKAEPHDDELKAMAAGIDRGWQEAGLHGDAFATIWGAARYQADLKYPNGWRGGNCAAQCRAAYIGGWAIGVQRFADGYNADGSSAAVFSKVGPMYIDMDRGEIVPGVPPDHEYGHGYVNPAQIPSKGYSAPMPPGGIDS